MIPSQAKQSPEDIQFAAESLFTGMGSVYITVVEDSMRCKATVPREIEEANRIFAQLCDRVPTNATITKSAADQLRSEVAQLAKNGANLSESDFGRLTSLFKS